MQSEEERGQADRRQRWIGSPARLGILQRLGIACFVISLGVVYVSFDAPGGAELRYWLFVVAHALLYIGFAMAALADAYAYRRFSAGRLVYMLCMAFLYAVLGPLVMSAAAAATHVHR